MRYFKTKDGFPFMANHNRPDDTEIEKTEYDSIVSERAIIAEQERIAIEDSQKTIREEEQKIQAKIRQIAVDAIAVEDAAKIEEET